MPNIKMTTNGLKITLLSSLLTACGGGTDSTVNAPVLEGQPTAPAQLTSRNWQSTATSNRSIPIELKARTSSDSLYINTNGLGDLSDKFWQIHIDTDNNPETGFQFKYNAWSNLSGVDYIIQNGYLFKSTANDSSWSWELLNEAPTFNSEKFPADGALQFFMSAYDKEICGTINVGAIVLNKNWNIETFYPVSNSLLKQTTTFCETNNPPIITANSASQVITVGDAFVDTGATATDVEDGDITSIITVQHRNLRENNAVDGLDIDTSVPGEYLIIYEVTDSAGKTSSVFKNLTVKLPLTGSITIDAQSQDWSTFGNNGLSVTRMFRTFIGELNVTDDEDYVYVLVKPSKAPSNVHWQLYIDSDNNAATGHRLQNGGADYLIENGKFSAFLGGLNQYQWSWDYGSAAIELAEGEEDVYYNDFASYPHKVFEIAVPKENLIGLGDSISISFVTRDSNWAYYNSLPTTFGAMLKHTLNNP